MYQIRILKLH